MKKLMILAAVFGLVCSLSVRAGGGEGWETDFKKAVERATKENKPLLLDFTGSDWCGWCIKLDKEVFSKESFKKWAESNLVLVSLDFPRKKQQSAELKKQNEELSEKYNVEGFPTIILLASDGKKVLGTTGYQSGGPDAYVKHLQEIIGKKK